jgi:hypothetical protein
MPTVSFTDNIQRHIDCPTVRVEGSSVREVLDAAFADNPRARQYVLDDQGAVRTHMVIFVDGKPIRDRAALSDDVPADASVYVMQALSGG